MRDLSWERVASSVYLYGIFAAYSIVVLSVHHAPLLQDYPAWVYEGVLFAHSLTGHPDAGYLFHAFPVPNSVNTVGLGLLTLLFGWEWAAKLWLVVLFGLTLYAMERLASAMGGESVLIRWVGPTILVLNMSFWSGFVNFQFGMVAFLLWVAALLRNEEERPVDVVRLAVLLVMVFLCHMIACAAALVVFAAFLWETRRYRLGLAMVPVVLLTVWYKVALTLLHPPNLEATEFPVAYGSARFLVYKANALLKAMGCVNVLDTTKSASVTLRLLGHVGFLLMLGMYAVFAVAFLGLCLSRWRGLERERASGGVRNTRFLWRAAVVLFVVGQLLPSSLLGVFNPGYRVLQLSFASAMFLALSSKTLAAQQLRRVVAVCAVLSCVLNLAQFFVVQRNPLMSGAQAHLPGHVDVQATWVQPAMRLSYYGSLKEHDMHQGIFSSGLYQPVE